MAHLPNGFQHHIVGTLNSQNHRFAQQERANGAQRNDYHARNWETRAGTVELHISQLRAGSRQKVTPVALQLKSLGVPSILTSASDANELARYSVFANIDNIGKPTDLTWTHDVSYHLF